MAIAALTGCPSSTPGAESDAAVAPDARGTDATPPSELGPDAAPSRPEASAEARAYARDLCAYAVACSVAPPEIAWFGGVPSCERDVAARADAAIARGAGSPSTWCHLTIANDANCDGLFDDHPNGTCERPAGSAALGATCGSHEECGRTPEGEPMDCVACTCRRRAVEGDVCSRVGEACDAHANLFCLPSATDEDDLRCRRVERLPEGAACDAEDPRTALLTCENGAMCFEGACVRRPRLGERCDPEGPWCLIGDLRARCADDAGGEPRCVLDRVRVWPAGEACQRGEYCVGGSFCPVSGVCPATCLESELACSQGGLTCDPVTVECTYGTEPRCPP